jgi:serine/threonine protein kinase
LDGAGGRSEAKRMLTPQECLSDASRRSKKSDVFSFGITLWEIAARRLPYSAIPPPPHAKNVWRLIEYIKGGGRPEVAACADAPPWFVNLILKCWDPDEAARPDFDAIVAEVEESRGGGEDVDRSRAREMGLGAFERANTV